MNSQKDSGLQKLGRPSAKLLRIVIGIFLVAISLLNAAKLRWFTLEPASVTLILVGFFLCILPLEALTQRLQSLKVGAKGVELVLDKLAEDVGLPAGARTELAGLSAHDLWALEDFATGKIGTNISSLKTPQRVAARALVDLKLLRVVIEDQERKLKTTELGDDLIRAAKEIPL